MAPPTHTPPEQKPSQSCSRRSSEQTTILRAWICAALCAAGVTLAVPAKADQLNVTNVSVPHYDSGIRPELGVRGAGNGV